METLALSYQCMTPMGHTRYAPNLNHLWVLQCTKQEKTRLLISKLLYKKLGLLNNCLYIVCFNMIKNFIVGFYKRIDEFNLYLLTT